MKEHSDPLRLDAPYRVVFALEFKGALRSNGTGEWTLDLPGVPSAPRSLVRVGHARVLPVASERRGALEYELRVRTPWHFSAVAPAEQGETAFRTYAWKTLVRPGADGADLEFHYSQQLRPRTFDFGQRDEGVAAWKKDRAAVQRLSDNGLALKVD